MWMWIVVRRRHLPGARNDRQAAEFVSFPKQITTCCGRLLNQSASVVSASLKMISCVLHCGRQILRYLQLKLFVYQNGGSEMELTVNLNMKKLQVPTVCVWESLHGVCVCATMKSCNLQTTWCQKRTKEKKRCLFAYCCRFIQMRDHVVNWI